MHTELWLGELLGSHYSNGCYGDKIRRSMLKNSWQMDRIQFRNGITTEPTGYTKVRHTVLFWIVTPCSLVDRGIGMKCVLGRTSPLPHSSHFGAYGICKTLCCTSVFLILRQLVCLLEQGIRPLQGCYLHRTTHTDIHVLSGIHTHDPSVRASEDSRGRTASLT
jgi:hypothetical protein